ncbi:MAG: hypothetical protein G01um101425_1035 [Candidatus Peregrinibacteria bacterium Gr01-1014_25]|nr:MAG: hypothetical protein G01um101425_1035 [Candidatus Peregrinibacteria bacterium Gr01-1014_25]
MIARALGIGIVLLAAFAPQVHAFEVPVNDGFVTDTVPLLTAQEEQEMESRLAAYRQQTSNEIAVVLVSTLDGEPAVDVAVAIGRKWGVGTSENDNGVIVLFAYEDRQVFIAPGYGLEGALPDIVVKGIIEEEMLPYFRDGKYVDGLVAGIDAMEKHIGGEYTGDRYAGGGGDGGGAWIVFFLFLVFNILAAWLGRSKSWWLGGILGGIFGVVLALLFTWWLIVPVMVLLGLLFDFIVSRMGYGRSRRGRRGGWGGGGFSGGGGSGGFGGFSGGSFGGGGAGGKW